MQLDAFDGCSWMHLTQFAAFDAHLMQLDAILLHLMQLDAFDGCKQSRGTAKEAAVRQTRKPVPTLLSGVLRGGSVRDSGLAHGRLF
jgi:hypothetical protein